MQCSQLRFQPSLLLNPQVQLKGSQQVSRICTICSSSHSCRFEIITVAQKVFSTLSHISHSSNASTLCNIEGQSQPINCNSSTCELKNVTSILAAAFWNNPANPAGQDLARRVCLQLMSGKCEMNTRQHTVILSFAFPNFTSQCITGLLGQSCAASKCPTPHHGSHEWPSSASRTLHTSSIPVVLYIFRIIQC